MMYRRELIDCFVAYYRVRGMTGTVGSKAIHLVRVCNAASAYFRGRDGRLSGDIENCGKVCIGATSRNVLSYSNRVGV